MKTLEGCEVMRRMKAVILRIRQRLSQGKKMVETRGSFTGRTMVPSGLCATLSQHISSKSAPPFPCPYSMIKPVIDMCFAYHNHKTFLHCSHYAMDYCSRSHSLYFLISQSLPTLRNHDGLLSLAPIVVN